MDLDLFKAAAKGNIKPFNKTEHLDQIVTQFRDTILHINIKAQKKTRVSTKFVEEVLDKCSSLLLQSNDKDDTPLIVAAKCGHVAIVEALVKRAKAQHEDVALIKRAQAQHQDLECGVVVARKMLRMTNKEGNTALHEAARNNSIQVVKLLIKEDPDFSYSPNNAGQTPLQIAASRANVSIVDQIFNLTAPNSKGMLDNQEKKKDLTKELTDQNGWTPLHFAAYYGHFNAAQELLKFDASAAHIGDKTRNMTPLHLAASQGHADIIKEIIHCCPDCYDLIDNSGWNVLHFSMVSLSVRTLRSLLKNSLLNSLINEKDSKGNTPLHVLAASHPDSYFDVRDDVSCDWYKGILHHVSPVLKHDILKLSKDIGGGSYPRSVIRIRDDSIHKVKESQLIVATLVATVAFAALLTVPDGFKSEDGPGKGTPVLSTHPLFIAFVAANTIAFTLSCIAILGTFLATFDMFRTSKIALSVLSFYTTGAVVSMLFAFMVGTLALAPTSFPNYLLFAGIYFSLLLVVLISLKKLHNFFMV